MNKQVVLHPIAISLYPTLSVFTVQYNFFSLDVVWRPALVSCALFVGLWVAIGAVRKEYKHTAVYVSATAFLFYAFAAVQEATSRRYFENVQSGNMILIGFLALVLVAVALYVRFRRYIDELTYALNVIGIILLVTPIMMSLFLYYRGVDAAKLLPDREPLYAADATFSAPEHPPDIYYLVLDGYGRADFLAEEYGFDNSALIDFLKRQNFYVAERSRANYMVTLVSLASALNYEHLDKLLGSQLADFTDQSLARALIRHSRVVTMLKRAGYTIVSIESQHSPARIADPDVNFTKWRHLNYFEIALLRMTPAPWLAGTMGVPILYDHHRDRIVYSFDRLLDAAELPGPKFVYAHIFVGHPPFVFGPRGERVYRAEGYTWDEGEKYTAAAGRTRDDYIAGYRDQVTYLNGKLRLALKTILEKAARPPIVIAFGDHGPGSRLMWDSLEGTDIKERYGILNAYHLPAIPESPGSATEPYPSISPVNTFRVIFNRYFGTDYPLLEDKSVYTPVFNPYRFIPVPAEEWEDEPDPDEGDPAAFAPVPDKDVATHQQPGSRSSPSTQPDLGVLRQ